MPWGAAAVIGGALISSNAQRGASRDQANASDRTAQLSHDQYLQTREDATPFREASYDALGRLRTGIGPNGQFSRTFSGLGSMSEDPGYQFRMDQGIDAIDRGAAARGTLLSGGRLKALQKFGQEYASGEYQNAFNRFQSNQTNAFNRLSSIAGLGQTSANTVANASANNVANQTNAIIGGANASAAGRVGTANTINSGINSLANWYQQRQFMANSGGGGGPQMFTAPELLNNGIGSGGYGTFG